MVAGLDVRKRLALGRSFEHPCSTIDLGTSQQRLLRSKRGGRELANLAFGRHPQELVYLYRRDQGELVRR